MLRGARYHADMTRRRHVTLCDGTPVRGRHRLWAFGYESLASLTGLSVGTLRNMVSAGTLDPSDLASVARLIGYVNSCTHRGSDE